ncbi:SAM-dependent methyltransferase [Nonomuraea terrae]|nr:class I SAM-dependent methyltransferase [Nonomuraea terrae]
MTAEPTSADVGAYYDRVSDMFAAAMGGNVHVGYWHDESDDSSIEVATDRLTDMVGERLALSQGQHVLDVGCGNGKPAHRIATRNGVHVTGITISEHQLRQALERVKDAPDLLRFELADALRLPFGDGSFDGVFAIESLGHIADKITALGEMGRIVRPGGRLVFADLTGVLGEDGQAGKETEASAQMLMVAGLPTADQYRELIQAAGFDVLEVVDIGENTRKTYDHVADVLKATAADFKAEGQDVPDDAELEELSDSDEMTYVLITAVRRAE